MIYFNGVSSIIESAYLRDLPGDNIKESGIFVNPGSITYLTGKTVVVTTPSYPTASVSLLLQHRNIVVSRVMLENMDGVILNPYISRPEWGLMWNGSEVEKEINSIDELLDNCSFSPETLTCYFPKVLNTTLPLMDRLGNLTGLGYALHQVGQMIDPELAFQDLDVLKTKKMQI